MKTKLWLSSLLLTFCFVVRAQESGAFVNASPQRDYLYVSLDSEHSIAIYGIDAVNGELELVKKIVVSGEPRVPWRQIRGGPLCMRQFGL